jgi:transaldolase
LWASTSTKNPHYADLAYVNSLIGPHTVNTMPDATLTDFLDHGVVARTVDKRAGEAQKVLDDLGELGVDMADVSRTLEDEGVAAFAKSFDELLQRLSDKANALTGER